MGKRTAAILGITGQDGSYLAEFLLRRGYRVCGMVRRSSSPNFARLEGIRDQIELLSGDLLDQSSINSFLAEIVRLNVNNFFAQILKLGLSAAAGSSSAAGQAPVYDSRTPGVGMARGTNYVPYDGFRATLHEGEAVVPKAFNPAAAGGGGDTNVEINITAPVEPMSEWRLQQTIREAAVAGVREKQLRGGL